MFFSTRRKVLYYLGFNDAKKMEDAKMFTELKREEIVDINGGVGFVAGLAIGVAVGWVADGILTASTGKSGGEWVATGINSMKNAEPRPSYWGIR